MFVVFIMAAVLIAHTQSAAIVVPTETKIVETAENKDVKASVDEFDISLLSANYTQKSHEKDVDLYLDTAVQVDKFGCGSRLICELHRRAESELLPEEILLRSMLLDQPLAVSTDGPKVAKGRGVFQYAAYIGSTAKNSETCSRAFARCPFDSDTILLVFRTIENYPTLKSLAQPFPNQRLQAPKETYGALRDLFYLADLSGNAAFRRTSGACILKDHGYVLTPLSYSMIFQNTCPRSSSKCCVAR